MWRILIWNDFLELVGCCRMLKANCSRIDSCTNNEDRSASQLQSNNGILLHSLSWILITYHWVIIESQAEQLSLIDWCPAAHSDHFSFNPFWYKFWGESQKKSLFMRLRPKRGKILLWFLSQRLTFMMIKTSLKRTFIFTFLFILN